MLFMMVGQINSECLRLSTAWDSDIRPDKAAALDVLNDLEKSARFMGADETLADVLALRTRIELE